MRVRPSVLMFIFASGLIWAEDIDTEILKDLEFYSQLETVETQDLIPFSDQELIGIEANQDEPTAQGGDHD